MARTDSERLDWLTAKGRHWVARESETGRGYRLHQTSPADRMDRDDVHRDPRAAIDAAMDKERVA